MIVTISGTAKSGKTAALQVIRHALLAAGMEVQVEDKDGDFRHPRHPEVLAGGTVELRERRDFSPSLFSPVKQLNQDIG